MTVMNTINEALNFFHLQPDVTPTKTFTWSVFLSAWPSTNHTLTQFKQTKTCGNNPSCQTKTVCICPSSRRKSDWLKPISVVHFSDTFIFPSSQYHSFQQMLFEVIQVSNFAIKNCAIHNELIPTWPLHVCASQLTAHNSRWPLHETPKLSFKDLPPPNKFPPNRISSIEESGREGWFTLQPNIHLRKDCSKTHWVFCPTSPQFAFTSSIFAHSTHEPNNLRPQIPNRNQLHLNQLHGAFFSMHCSLKTMLFDCANSYVSNFLALDLFPTRTSLANRALVNLPSMSGPSS